MVSLLLVGLAAFFNAVMDALENENFFESIFKTYNKSFWYKRESWRTTQKIFGYHFDAWHLSKSLMVISIAFALLFAAYEPSLFTTKSILINNLLKAATIGFIWNSVFRLFYHIIFKIK